MNETIIKVLEEMTKAFRHEAYEEVSIISNSGNLEKLNQNISRAMGIIKCFAEMVDTLNRATGYNIPEENMDAARTTYRDVLEAVNKSQEVWVHDNVTWND